MTEPAVTDVFGAGATQTATQLIIMKTDLATSGGLIPSATNTAESLLASILVTAQATLTTANQTNNADQSMVINDNSNDVLAYRNSTTYRRKTKTVTFDKPDTTTTFNPNDY